MSLIKARTRGKQLVRHITLDRETNETLYAYAHFLGSRRKRAQSARRHDARQRQGVRRVASRASSRSSLGERRTAAFCATYFQQNRTGVGTPSGGWRRR